MRAAEQGRTEHVIELCRDGSCDVNAATVHGFFSCMQLLKCTGHTPILWEYIDTRLSILVHVWSIFVEYSSDFFGKGFGNHNECAAHAGVTATMYAACNGLTETVLALVESGAKTNAIDSRYPHSRSLSVLRIHRFFHPLFQRLHLCVSCYWSLFLSPPIFPSIQDRYIPGHSR